MVKRATTKPQPSKPVKDMVSLTNGWDSAVAVDPTPQKSYQVIATEATAAGTKRVLNKLDGCDNLWKNDEKNQVAANVGFITGGIPVLAFLSLLAVIENAALNPFKRAVGYRNKGCEESGSDESDSDESGSDASGDASDSDASSEDPDESDSDQSHPDESDSDESNSDESHPDHSESDTESESDSNC
jgi:hypothetical protein